MKNFKEKQKNRGGVVRVSSGEYRGREILTPGGTTHPMGEREKIALFNMISTNLPGAMVLDAYAGSGALGIEALSRGAKFCTFVENNTIAISIIKENLAHLGLNERAEVIKQSVNNFTTNDIFDLIIADPPYNNFKVDEIVNLQNLLAKDGILVLSHPTEITEIDGLTLLKSRQYARANISIFTK